MVLGEPFLLTLEKSQAQALLSKPVLSRTPWGDLSNPGWI